MALRWLREHRAQRGVWGSDRGQRTKSGAKAFKALHAYAGACLWNSLTSPF